MLKAFEAMEAYQTNVAVWTLRKLSRAGGRHYTAFLARDEV